MAPIAVDDVIQANGPASVKLSNANVVVFDDPVYVDSAGGTASESDNVQASLRSLGHSVTTFTGTTAEAFATALVTADVFLVPELERRNFLPSEEVRDVIRAFVSNGGSLVIHGDRDSGDEAFLNAIFGWSLVNGYEFTIGTTSATTDRVGTTFADDPGTLNLNNGTYMIQRASLPEDALILYTNTNNTAVAAMGVGSGQVVTLAYDWYSARPVGTQDGGWLQVLDSAISAAEAPLTNEDTPALIDVADLLANDSDPDGATLAVSGVAATSTLGAALTLNLDGTITYDPTGSATLDALSQGDRVEDS
ncbi:cadherin-like domain-containing protein, partial [Mesobacterium pallidum]|uniref:cadherin-like domain-containing protein n=1 Tax=Mesobacterium pallidum TaxID=2872037 RepID=UPI001EE2C9F7